MWAKTAGSGGSLSGAAAIVALAAVGWLALGLTAPSPQPLDDVVAAASGGSGWSSPLAWRGDRTRPTLRPEARPAVVVQGEPVVFFAHGTDDGSGVASQACVTGRLPRFDRPGVHTVTCTVRDRAGNIAVGRTTYGVISNLAAGPTRS